jgi:hypothetical protein
MNLFKISLVFIFLLLLVTNGCSLENNSPEIQERKDIDSSKTIGKVTFKRIAYKGVYQVNLNESVLIEEVNKIAGEIINKYNVSLVKPSFPEVKNPRDRIFWIENVSDETILEISKDDKIKFITQHFTSH